MAKANGTQNKMIEEKILDQKDPLIDAGTSEAIARSDKKQVTTNRGGKPAPTNAGTPEPKRSRQEVNLQTVSTTLRPSGAGVSAAPEGVVTMGVTFSGTDNLVVGRESQTPVQREARQSSPRYIRKDESIVRSIDDVANAQTYVDIEGPKRLHEAPSEPQGYAGKEVSKAVLIQKLSGVIPADRSFAASVDLISRDHMVYVDKQIVEASTDPNVSPLYNYTFDEENGRVVQGGAYSNPRQNFSPTHLEAVFDGTNLVSLTPFSDDLSITGQSDEVINRSSPAALTNRNKIEAARRRIEEKAGDPNKENFSPLGRKVNYPNGVLNLMRDYEIMTGTEVAMSFRSLSHALAYQINKAAKDGHRPADAAREMVYSSIDSLANACVLDGVGTGSRPLFDPALMRQGAATLLIQLFDTNRKYNTRGDFLTISKSFRSFLDQGANHLDSFRMPKDFMPYINNIDFFSTIDRDYDEALPVYATEFIHLIHPRKWENCSTITAGLNDTKKYLVIYNDMIDFTITELTFPLLNGIARYLQRHARKIYEAVGGTSGNVTVRIPILHSKQHITLWDQLVCASASDIEYARQQSFRDLLAYERENGPAFEDLVNVSADVTKAKFFGFTDYVSPLSIGKMTDEAALTWILPETFSAWGRDTTANNEPSFMMPWYFSDSSLEGFTQSLDEENCYMNFPMVRYGMTHSNLMKFLKVGERNTRLAYDIVTSIPASMSASGSYYSTALKYSNIQSGPAILVREAAGAEFPTVQEILRLPRELGLGFVPVSFYKRQVITVSDDSRIVGPYTDITDEFLGDLSYVAKVWRAANGNESSSLGESLAQNVARGANFAQIWEHILAVNSGAGATDSARIALSLNGMIDEDGATEDETLFSPYPGANGFGNASLPHVLTFSKAWFFMIHYLDFMLSPYDLACVEGVVRDGEEVRVDPFEKAYMYGLVGFLPSEYTEDHRARCEITDAAGMGYFEDYYHDHTSLLR